MTVLQLLTLMTTINDAMPSSELKTDFTMMPPSFFEPDKLFDFDFNTDKVLYVERCRDLWYNACNNRYIIDTVWVDEQWTYILEPKCSEIFHKQRIPYSRIKDMFSGYVRDQLHRKDIEIAVYQSPHVKFNQIMAGIFVVGGILLLLFFKDDGNDW